MTRHPFRFASLPPHALMGIVNVTPDSFSDGGAFFGPAAAIAHARSLAAAGASLLDLGAEASSFFRAGIQPITPEEQLRRLQEVLPALRAAPALPLSIDTRSALVASSTLAAGAALINDISAGLDDPALLPTIAHSHAAVILMHRGPSYPATPAANDPDILQTVRAALADRITAALDAGIPRDRIAIDPGLGFGKTPADNWTLALHAHALADLGYPVVLGASRKRFLETPPPIEVRPAWTAASRTLAALPDTAPHARDISSAALLSLLRTHPIAIHRVHHVPLARAALTL